MRIKSVVISVPLLVAPLAFLAPAPPVLAAPVNVGPEGALRLLAQSRTLDTRCKYLNAAEHGELEDYVAKAEIAVARTAGAQPAQDARRAGIRLGKKLKCGPDARELVSATMDAARRAIRQVRAQRIKRVTKPRTERRRVVAQSIPAPKGKGLNKSISLDGYRRVATAYYLERRCQHLSRANAMAFWKQIVARHNAVLKKYEPGAVKRAQTRAQLNARAKGRCGARTAQIVKAGYHG